MKNQILLIVLATILFACKSDSNSLLKGDVSSIKESNYDVSEKFGEVVKGELTYNDAVYSYKYDANGNQTSFIVYDEDGEMIYKTETTYENDKPSMVTSMACGGNYYDFSEQRTVIFRDDNKTVWLAKKDEDGKLSTDTIIDLVTERGKNKIRTEKLSDGSQRMQQLRFDNKDRLVELKWFKDGKDLHQWDTNAYDDNLLTQKNQLDPKTGEIQQTTTYKYKLDEQQNWIERIAYKDGAATQLTERVINYR